MTYEGTEAPVPSSGRKARTVVLIFVSTVLTTATALALLPIGLVTFFRARRLYAAVATQLARGLLRLWGIRVIVHQDRPFPATQTVYVSNHSSTIDLFVLVALGLPNTRFFMWGRLRKYIPLGIIAQLMGTFFTVEQTRPAERTRIFQRADRTLRRTRESVYLSPEGKRVVTGEIGHFNKGAFHLATSLHAPIVPLYFRIPREADPGLGYDPQRCTVHVHVRAPIDTDDWRLDELMQNKERVREMFVGWHRESRAPERDEPTTTSTAIPGFAQ